MKRLRSSIESYLNAVAQGGAQTEVNAAIITLLGLLQRCCILSFEAVFCRVHQLLRFSGQTKNQRHRRSLISISFGQRKMNAVFA